MTKSIQSFSREDLIDQLIISNSPTLIGSDNPLFDNLQTDLHFRHILAKVQSNGLFKAIMQGQDTEAKPSKSAK